MLRLSYQSLLCSVGVCGMMGAAVSIGCRSDTTGPVPIDPAHLYYQLTLNHHAITLALTAPYDTITLQATPLSATGTALIDTGPTTYLVLNGDTSVTVSPTGVLRAVAPDAGGQVIAQRTVGGLTLSDTAIVNVNAVSPVPVFTTFALTTQPGDSAVTTVSPLSFVQSIISNSTVVPAEIIPMMLDAQGQAIPNIAFRLSSPLDRYNGTAYCTSNSGVDPSTGGCYVAKTKMGRMQITAEATVYGVSKAESILYTVGWPLVGVIGVFPGTPIGQLTPIGYFSPGDDTVAVGATVVWQNTLTNQLADIVFQDPSAAQHVDSTQWSGYVYNLLGWVIPEQDGGNIPAFPADSVCRGESEFVYADCGAGTGANSIDVSQVVRARQFLTAGTYPYHSALYGTTGVIHVLPESQVPQIPQ